MHAPLDYWPYLLSLCGCGRVVRAVMTHQSNVQHSGRRLGLIVSALGSALSALPNWRMRMTDARDYRIRKRRERRRERRLEKARKS
jgi:hypothetical protein